MPPETDSAYGRKTSLYGSFICLVIFASYLLAFFHRVSPSVLAMDMQQAFGVGAALLGALGSAYFYPYALKQFPTGLLVDTWGPRRTVSISLTLAAAGSIIMGLTDSIYLAIFGRVLVGLGVGTIFVANFKLITEWFSPRRLVVIGGLFIGVGGVGVFAASTPLAWLSIRLGWDWTLVAVGVLTAVMALVTFLVVRDRPADLGWPNLRPDSGTDRTYRRNPLRGFGEIVKSFRLWMLCLWAAGCIGTSFAFGSMWSVPYLQHVYHLSKAAASGYQAMFGVALIVGGPMLGFLANRWGRKRVLMLCSLVSMAVFGILIVWTDRIPSTAMYIALLFLFTFGTSPGQVMAAASKELFHPAIAGTSVGMVNAFPFLWGGALQVIMARGAGRGRTGLRGLRSGAYRQVFMICLGCALVSLVAACLTRETLAPRPAVAGR